MVSFWDTELHRISDRRRAFNEVGEWSWISIVKTPNSTVESPKNTSRLRGKNMRRDGFHKLKFVVVDFSDTRRIGDMLVVSGCMVNMASPDVDSLGWPCVVPLAALSSFMTSLKNLKRTRIYTPEIVLLGPQKGLFFELERGCDQHISRNWLRCVCTCKRQP